MGLLRTLAAGAALGLPVGPTCLGFCGPVAGAAMLASGERGLRGGARALASFLAGRLAGYVVFGAALGALGSATGWDAHSVPALAARALLAGVLVAAGFAAGRAAWFERHVCPAAGARVSRLPLALGLLSGVNICPPFLMAAGEVLGSGGAVAGGAFFVGFFAGTSVWLAPLALLPVAWRRAGSERLARLARGAAVVVGAAFLAQTLALLRPAGTPGRGPDRPARSAGGPAADAVREMFPQAARVEYLGTPPRFEVTLAPGGLSPDVFVALASAEGFGGAVPVLTAVDRKGTILAVRIVECRETPSYLARVAAPEVLGTFVGRSYADPISLVGVDAVSSATVTAAAVETAVRWGARAVAAEAIGLEPPGEVAEARIGVGWRDVVAIAYVIAVATAFWRPRPGRLRWAALAASVVVLGLLTAHYVSVADVARALSGAWPAWPAFAAWYVFFFGIVALTFARGRIYCRLICPFGALCAAAGELPVPKARPSGAALRWLARARWAVLAATIAAFALSASASVFAYEPYAPLFQMRLWFAAGEWAPVALAAAALVASAFVPRLWCRFLCPAGAALEVIARASPFVGGGDEAGAPDDRPAGESEGPARSRAEGAGDG